jgi:hypothetical protein
MLKEPSGQVLPVDGNRAVNEDLPSEKPGTWKTLFEVDCDME